MPHGSVGAVERRSNSIALALLALAPVLGLREAWSPGNILGGWEAADHDSTATDLAAGKGFVREGTGGKQSGPDANAGPLVASGSALDSALPSR